jgi:predicted HTH transcriptional regulator
MASTGNNYVTHGISGAIGKELVFRTIKGKTYACKNPDMSNIIPSKNQTKKRKKFSEAVKFAQSIMKDPEKAAAYEKKPGQRLYHTIITDYMRQSEPERSEKPAYSEATKKILTEHSLNEAQIRAVAYVGEHARISNKIYQSINSVSKPTATRHLQELARLQIIKSNDGKGAGAHYIMGPAWK